MATLGQTLREAREKKGVTVAAAAAATRIKTAHIQELERDDFSRMAAPAYAKGFIKLYAEYLGLDSAPMIREYADLHAPRERPPLIADEKAPDEETPLAPRAPWKLPAIRIRLPRVSREALLRAARVARGPAIAAAALLVAVCAVVAFSRYLERRVREAPARVSTPVEELRAMGPPAVIRDPPDPYLNAAPAEAKR
jgi:transcriptional regulator with XRE-family HTH domain